MHTLDPYPNQLCHVQTKKFHGSRHILRICLILPSWSISRRLALPVYPMERFLFFSYLIIFGNTFLSSSHSAHSVEISFFKTFLSFHNLFLPLINALKSHLGGYGRSFNPVILSSHNKLCTTSTLARYSFLLVQSVRVLIYFGSFRSDYSLLNFAQLFSTRKLTTTSHRNSSKIQIPTTK